MSVPLSDTHLAAARVFVSGGGRRYHASRDCRALEMGQFLWDWDCPDDYCSHTYHGHPRPIRDMRLDVAVAGRKLPCLACKPPVLIGAPPWDDFGHGPEPIYADGPEIQCRACTRRFGDVVPWPCTTARVLDLATVGAGQ